jgi:hypothetical protein
VFSAKGRTVEIIAQRRFEFAPDVEATVHQVYVELPREVEDREDRLIPLVEDWAKNGNRRAPQVP